LSSSPTGTIAIVQTQAENGGAQEIARQLGRGLERRGWRVRQIFFYRRTDSFDADPNSFFCARTRPSSPLALLKMLGALYRELRRIEPEAVITLQHYGNIIGAPVAKIAGAPIVIANQLSTPQVIPPAVGVVDEVLGMLGAYDHIVVNSHQTEAIYRAYPARYVRRLQHIAHGFHDKSAGSLTKRQARDRLGLSPDAPLLGCAARLHPTKRVDLAIRVIAESPVQHLALAGQGQERQVLEELALALGVAERVHFLGELDVERMGAFLAALDCFVFPSAAETFGLAPVEAAQAGVPVVATDIPVLREVLCVEAVACALFVEPTDTAAFAEAVARVLHDRALRASLIETGQRLCERYPLERMIDQYCALLHGAGA
jgi:glycosyltransferase involved in cell wall biosynthesis